MRVYEARLRRLADDSGRWERDGWDLVPDAATIAEAVERWKRDGVTLKPTHELHGRIPNQDDGKLYAWKDWDGYKCYVLFTQHATTLYRLPTAPDAWGDDVDPEDARAAARMMADAIRTRWPDADVRLVPGAVADNSDPEGDEIMVAEIDAWRAAHFQEFLDAVCQTE